MNIAGLLPLKVYECCDKIYLYLMCKCRILAVSFVLIIFLLKMQKNATLISVNSPLQKQTKN